MTRKVPHDVEPLSPATDPQPAPAQGQEHACEVYAQLLRAWNARDAGGFAALFAPDGSLIGFDGSQATGAAEIEGHLAPIFSDHPTGAYVARVRQIRSLGADAAMLRAIVGMVPPGRVELNPAVNAVQSLLVERRGEGWRIVLFQTTPAQYHGRPQLVDSHTAEVEQVRAAGAVVG